MSVYRNAKSSFYWYDFQCKGRRFFGSTKRTSKREAETVERQERERAKREMAAAGAMTPLTLDYACGTEWERSGKHAATAEDIRRSLQWLLDHFGKDTLLDDIANDDAVEGAVAKRRGEVTKTGKPVSNATVNRTVTEPLKRILRRARLHHKVEWRWRLLTENNERVRELVGDEGDRLEAETRDDYQPFFRFLRASGLRRNEALFLRWHQVHWQEGQIVIDKDRGDKGGKDEQRITKPLTPTLQNILRPLEGHDKDRVFTYVAKRTFAKTVKGRRYSLVKGQRYPMTEEGVKAAWRRMIAASGVINLRLHDLRHDFGTKLLRSTKNLKLVQKAMCHASIATTSKYAHVLADEIGEGMEDMERQRERDRESRNKSRTPAAKVV